MHRNLSQQIDFIEQKTKREMMLVAQMVQLRWLDLNHNWGTLKLNRNTDCVFFLFFLLSKTWDPTRSNKFVHTLNPTHTLTNWPLASSICWHMSCLYFLFFFVIVLCLFFYHLLFVLFNLFKISKCEVLKTTFWLSESSFVSLENHCKVF